MLFESGRYGYSLRLPDDKWLVVERRGEWAAGTTFTQDDPGVDELLRPISLDHPYEVYLNSQPLLEGMTFDEWLSQYDQLQAEAFPNCVRQGDFGSTAVDGGTARMGTYVCEGGDPWFATESLWHHDHRVYSLRVSEGTESSLQLDTAAEAELWLERITMHDPMAPAEFQSDRYGYTLRLPGDDWGVVEKRGEWTAGAPFSQEDPGVDIVLGPIQEYPHDVFLSSQSLAAEASFAEWLEAYDQLGWYFPNCDFDDEFEFAMVTALTGDRLQMFRHIPARIGTAECDGSRWAEALWEHGGRAYSLRVGEHHDSAVPIDPRQEIEIWLERLTLHPASP